MALTIRERNGQPLGTLQDPTPLPVNLTVVEPPISRLEVTLGYDGEAPTAVWAFEGKRRMEVSATRVSDDPLANAIGVTVLDPVTRRVLGVLVRNDSGTGDTIVLPKGRYLLVASLGLMEQVRATLLVRIAPPKVPLVGRLQGRVATTAVLRPPERLLEGVLLGGDVGSRALIATTLLEAAANCGGTVILENTPVEDLPNQISGILGGGSVLRAARSPFFWVDGRGRRMGPNVRITPLTYNQLIWRRADYRLLLRVRDDVSGDPVDISALTVTVAVHDARRLVRHALLTVETAALASGLIDARLGWEQTIALPDQVYVDVLLENGSGQQQYPLEAIWLVQDGFTA